MILKRWQIIIIPFLVALLSVAAFVRYAAAQTLPPPQPPALAQEMARMIVRLSPTAVSSSSPLFSTTVSKLEQRTAVIDQLQQTAVSSQSPLRRQLDDWQEDGRIAAYQPLWIINAIVVTGTETAVAQIAARPDVVSVTPDAPRRYFDQPDASGGDLRALLAPRPASFAAGWGVERINAPAVWHGLGIDGDGVTIALMDSGVDWLHPDLLPAYRGNLGGGVYEHAGNWLHAGTPTATAPIDLIGHGTHVAGTAVGQNGIGVAPGANWIAVSIADESGFIFESEVHLGFQWLLAPDGDPALAPDIVNNSWGGNPYATLFVEDVAALQAAGIIPLFSAGNDGPFTQTIGSPASYSGTIAIAASDDVDAPAWFSSRGPSVLTDEQKPWIAAPGTAILSTLPGGAYGKLNGTSMAAPHAAGAMALLLQADPTLTEAEITTILAQTAVPLSTTHPNNVSGWGRLDAYAAVASVVESGVLEGIVESDGQPLPGAVVSVTVPGGEIIQFQTDANGRYRAYLQAGTYDLTAAPFGYQPAVAAGALITVGQTTVRDLTLTPLPGGTISGIARDVTTNAPLTAVIRVEQTPIVAATDGNGRYTLQLPAGSYNLIVDAEAHRLGRALVNVEAGSVETVDFSLAASPSILLVDSGQWYYRSYADYYQESLQTLDYHLDTWTIRNPVSGVPTASDLEPYDTIIWSNPSDSPGYLGAGQVISDALGLGKDLLISGQHVGVYDGTGFVQFWWHSLLGAKFVDKTTVTAPLTGVNAFVGTAPTLNAADSANNQVGPDQSLPRTGALSQPAFLFDDGLAGGLQGGHCQPFRIAYFGFGLEGIAASERETIIEDSFAYFDSPRLDVGLRWESDSIDDFAVVDSRLVYTFTLRNMSETLTDTFDFHLDNAAWATTLVTETVTLGNCQTAQTVLELDVPADAPPDALHEMTLTAVSRNNPALSASLSLRHKTPGHILLVDDDRWYDQQPLYAALLDEMNLRYDIWDVDGNSGSLNSGGGRGSPPQNLLNAYDILLWYTAYDWFAPITAVENQRLTNYLAQGGRLFLSSQDFLYYNRQTALAQRYFGVADYHESVEPRQIYGAGNPLAPPPLAGPLALIYAPYQNNSDGVIPAAHGQPFFWQDRGMAAATATADEQWRALFFSFPLEKLPADALASTMNHVVGWLSDLGETTFVVDRRAGEIGELRLYTITLRNGAAAPANAVVMTNTLPVSLTLQPQTVSGGAVYDAATRQLRWSGVLQSGGAHEISYWAVPQAGAGDGTLLENELAVYYGRHRLTFNRIAALWVNAPDLSGSTLTAVVSPPSPTPLVTYTLQLVNSGQKMAISSTAVMTFSEPLTPVVGLLTTTLGVTAVFTDHLFWTGDLEPNASVTVAATLERTPSLTQWQLPVTAVVDDRITAVTLLYNQAAVPPPYVQYLPIIFRAFE